MTKTFSGDSGGIPAILHAAGSPLLGKWLAENLSGFAEPFEMTPLLGGQSNPTFKLAAGTRTWVLRRQPEGHLLASAHAVDREFRIMRALESTGVPVPNVHAYCGNLDVIGSAFYVMEFVDGRHFMDPRLPGVPAAERGVMFSSMNKSIAELHMLDPMRLGLGDFGREGNYIARQINRWSRQYRESGEAVAAMDDLIAWLSGRIPAQSSVRIIHGDYKVDNLIWHRSEPRVTAILDWELSTLGDPLVDFAYHSMAWRIAPELFRGLAGSDFDELGIPRESEYVRAYFERFGQSAPPNWDYYIVFCMFRIAAILLGILQRARQGNAAGESAIGVGMRGPVIAAQAWQLARSLR